VLERQRLGLPVESTAVVQSAELFRPAEKGTIAVLIATIPIHSQKVEEVVTLENTVLLHHPQVRIRDERLEYGRRNIGMIIRAQRIPYVVQQRAHDVLFVSAVPVR